MTLLEDEVRDQAKSTLWFDTKEEGVQQGTGQVTEKNEIENLK